MLSSSMILIGILKMMFRLLPELIESAKKVKFKSIDLSLAILMRLKCLKERHKNLDWTKLSSLVATLNRLDKARVKINCQKDRCRLSSKRVFLASWRMANITKMKHFSSRMLTKSSKTTPESPNIHWLMVLARSLRADLLVTVQIISSKSMIPISGTSSWKMCSLLPNFYSKN